MKLYRILLVAMLFVFSNPSFALAIDEWEYKTIVRTLKATPGCKDKDKAIKQASGYRLKKYSKLACNTMTQGWGLDRIENKGEAVCEACEDDDDEEVAEEDKKYSCYLKDVVIRCKTVVKGW